MTLEMRTLTAKDIFPVIQVINKLKIVKPLKDLYAGITKEKALKELAATDPKHAPSAEETGVGMAFEMLEIVLANIGNAEKEVNTLLASLTGVKTKDIEDLAIDEYFGLIASFFKKREFTDFMKSVQKFMPSAE